MFKKILIASVLTVTSGIALAGTPYVGGSLGFTNLGYYNNNQIQAGAIGKLFGGYGSIFGPRQNIYLGGELNLDLAHYPSEGSVYGLGASLIPGLMLTQHTMAYARIGAEVSRNTNGSANHVGSQLGLGLQTSLTPKWDIRGEYIRTSNTGDFNYSSNMIGSQLNLGLVYKFN